MQRRLPFTGALILCMCSVLSTSLTAQNPTTSARYTTLDQRSDVTELTISPERGTPTLIELSPAVRQQAQSRPTTDVLNELYHLPDQQVTPQLEHTTREGSGLKVERYRQYYRGIKVEHGRYNAVYNDEGLQLVSSEHYEVDPALKIQPTLSRDQALQRALDYVGARQYAWEFIEENYVRLAWSADFLAHVAQEVEAVRPGGELVIVDDYDTEATDPDLAWKFNIYANDPLSRAWIYINAHTGKVMLRDAIIKHASQPITVQTRYAGSREIMVDRQAGLTDPHNNLPLLDSRTNLPATAPLYVLRDDTRGKGLETYDLNGQGGLPLSLPAIYAQGKAFTDDNLDWSLTEHKRGGSNEAENDDIAWDAHWGTQMVYDYWLKVHGRRSYDDNDIAIKSFLHYGVAYDNAFWNGTAMTYGDGSYQGGLNPDGSFAPLMSLDVCGHEIGHAICSNTADLVYAKESGAMNEGFSDIWGAAIEAYVIRAVDPTLSDIMAPFGIGEQIDERDGGVQYPADGWVALRYMDEPGRAGDPDTYGGAFWKNPDCSPNLANDQCGVHTNSGVLNKWFFLLTAGENGTNDLGNNYSVSGLGFEVSERIAYGTELLLTPNATFTEARAASIAFARSMSEAGGGKCGNYEEQVTNAWYGVGVGDAFDCAQVAAFTTPTTFVSERVEDDNGCTGAKFVYVEAAVTGNGKASLAGTATEGVDYYLYNAAYKTGPNGFGVHNFKFKIYSDGIAEADETIIISLGHGTTHKLTILDDDVPLTVGNGTAVLLENNMRSSGLPSGWSATSFSDNGPNGWFASPIHGAVVSPSLLGNIAPTPTYDGNDQIGDDILLSSPMLDARGLHQIKLSFDWKAGGETDVPTDVVGTSPVAVPFDYGNLAYSFDGETWTDFPTFDPFVGPAGVPTTGNFANALPDFLQGTRFYLGWRWRNDGLVSTAYSFSFENVRVTAEHPRIATKVSSDRSTVYGNATSYFTSPDGSEVLAAYESRSNHYFGCTTVEILTEGTGKNRCSGGVFMDKTYRITSRYFRPNSPITVRFYLTDAEIEGFENSSGHSRNELRVYTSKSYVCSPNSKPAEARLTYVEEIDGGVEVIAYLQSDGDYFSIGTPDASLPFLREGKQTKEASALSVYPNPFTTQFEVVAPNSEGGTARIFALTGQLLVSKTFSGVRAKIETATLPAGAYLLRLELADGTRTEHRIVKQ
ncbi:Zn-dependent metalloprotease [Lewinella aquimaris]|uniref:Zn-dependent metalloprotease n=1 Tax=Neolewinella aquimaris TaxID=1835722 RepID=A0A840E3Z1_9BACT|nr:M4 family metallopeptidase [Neolewinella aquimaris]MBB4078462.1 Zn-dependent metalloprotease [Neolewinella aquimaris]